MNCVCPIFSPAKPYICQMQQLEDPVEIVDLATDGRGVAKVDGRVYFVEQGVPGDHLRLEVLGKRRKQWQARIATFVQPSPHRTQPVCQHFQVCGGCKWQHVAYATQAHHKQQWVHEALSRIGGLSLPPMQPILAAEQLYGYRNKLEYSFASRRWLTQAEVDSGQVFEQHGALGFHVPGVFEKVVHIDHCHLQPEPGNAIRNFVHRYAQAQGAPYYSPKAHTGLLRNLLIRSSSLGQLMVMLLLTETGPFLDGLMEALQAEFPQITSLGYLINTKLNDSYHDLVPITVHGPAYIEEQLGRYRFRIGPKSFFQTNTAQAERLYQLVYDLMPEHSPLVYDLYCGAGSIGIYVSSKAEKIVGVEYIEEAVANARENVRLNGLSGFTFVAGDMAQVLNEGFVQQHGKPQVVIADPPRAGMDAKVCKALLALAPPTILYVSCNPGTQARDLALLAHAYRIDYVQPVDLFPHTTHVENVVRLQRIHS